MVYQIELVVKLVKRWEKYIGFEFSSNIMECRGLVWGLFISTLALVQWVDYSIGAQ